MGSTALASSACVKMSSASMAASSCARGWMSLAFWVASKSNNVRSLLHEVTKALLPVAASITLIVMVFSFVSSPWTAAHNGHVVGRVSPPRIAGRRAE